MISTYKVKNIMNAIQKRKYIKNESALLTFIK